ncbi:restriction endonuclease subunit S [Sphingobacterium composti Ten et al. 2007 non Yoo et al. 2007]|uniref:restriction endonuclease subunit S n=1 Tax=Sphingobacterium composti TaxID=363260 RepID=UPI001356C11F|nr:restriction endonuclease subunit S [Sphingobacterium composti Ten et al. 2007 non Yoo et al. 2007]
MGRKYLIKDFLKRIKRPVQLNPDKEYKLVTISSKHRGIKLREFKKGSLIKSNMYEVKAGDFVLSGIDARNGAFGIIPQELDGGIITNDFWCLEINEDVISKELFLELTATTWFDELCNKGSDGTTNRVRLQKDKFFNQEVVLPVKHEQKQLLEKILTIKGKSNILKQEIEYQKQLLSQFKQAILQEAIQGKLTENWRVKNPNVEPASELLKRIKAEKTQLIKEKKIKKEKELAPISKEETPFEIPENWVWCRLGELFQTTSGGTPLRNNVSYWNGDIKWYKSGELNDCLLVDNSEEYITEKGLIESSATLFPKGTLLIAMYGATAGKLAILNSEATTNQAVCGFFENKNIITRYLFNYLFAHRTQMIKESWGMSQPNISQTYLRNFVFALPPFSEQQAIVEKVESLMAKCTVLEREIAQSKQYANILMQAVLKESFESKKALAESVQMDRSIQLALMQMMFKQNLGINYGEVIMQKTAYNLDHLNHNKSKYFQYDFQRSNHGAFSVQLRKDIEVNPYLSTKSTEKGKVICIEQQHNSALLDAFSTPIYKDYIQSLTNLLEIYSLPIIGKKSDQIELFNTVLKIMNDLSVTDIETIYGAMENWEIEQKGYKTKAEKFSRIETEKILELIVKIRN